MNKLLDWIVKLKFPFYIDDHPSTWKWFGDLKIPKLKGDKFILIIPTPEQREKTEKIIEDLFRRKLTERGEVVHD